MIIYGSSGIGALGEVLLLKILVEQEKQPATYFLYPHSPDHAVRAVHYRFCLKAGTPTFNVSRQAITDAFDLRCLDLDYLLKVNDLWQITLECLLKKIPGQDFNVIDRLHPEEKIRKSTFERGLHSDLLQFTLDDLHRTGYTLGGRLIYWLIAKVCQTNQYHFMAPAIRTNDVYAFFPEGLLAKTGYLHIRLAAPQPPEQGWEPVPPTVWPHLDKDTRDELLAVAKWLIGQPDKRIDVLLEGDKREAKAFYRGLPLNF